MPVNFAYTAGDYFELGLTSKPVIYIGSGNSISAAPGADVSGSLRIDLGSAATLAPIGASGNVLWGIYSGNRAVTVGSWEMISGANPSEPPRPLQQFAVLLGACRT